MGLLRLNGRKKFLVIASCVFLFSFLWQIFFTYGIGFFWESFDIFHIYWNDSDAFHQLIGKYKVGSSTILPLRFSVGLSIAKEFIKKYFVVDRLFQIGFDPYKVTDRPYAMLLWDLMRLCFGVRQILFTLSTALIFAITCTIVFCVISELSLLFALLGTAIFATSSEIWTTVVYKGHFGVLALCSTFLAVLLFIKLSERKTINDGVTVLYYFLIITASNFASLTMGDGRYLAIIFFLTLLLFQREKFRSHLPMLIILFMMEVPIFGYLIKLFVHSFSPINLWPHLNGDTSTLKFIKIAWSNYQFPRNAIGNLLLTVLYISLAINIFYFFQRKNRMIFKSRLFSDEYTKSRFFIFLLWFISAFAMVARARSFAYDGPASFQIGDLVYFILPFILFLSYYIFSITNSLKKPFSIIFLAVCFCFMGAQIMHNVIRLNRFRGGWGNHFCAWENAKKYIDSHSDYALALAYASDMHYRPFVFNKSNNKLLYTQFSCDQSDFCDLKFIESKFNEGYSDIFVFGKNRPQFRGDVKSVILQQEEFLDGDSGDLLDHFKRFIGHPSKPVMHMYHFKLKQNSIEN